MSESEHSSTCEKSPLNNASSSTNNESMPEFLLAKIETLEKNQLKLQEDFYTLLKLQEMHRQQENELNKDKPPCMCQYQHSSDYEHYRIPSNRVPDYETFPNTQLRNVLHSMGHAVFILRPNGEVTYWNRSAEDLYGWRASEAIGQNILDLIVDDAIYNTATQVMDQVGQGKQWSGQLPLKKKTGEVFNAMMTDTPLYEGDQFSGIIAVSTDSRSFDQSEQQDNNSRNNMRKAHQYILEGLPKLKVEGQNLVYMPFKNTVSKVASKILSQLRISDNFSNDICHNDAKETARQISEDPSNMKAEMSLQEILKQKSQPSTPEPVSDESNKDWISPTNCDINEQQVASIAGTASELEGCEIAWDDLTLFEKIGEGSCGMVYHGIWFGSDVAVKVFTGQQYSTELLSVFRKEVSIMQRLRHPNVVLFMGAVFIPPNLSIVTELLPRGSLFLLLHRSSQRLDWKKRLSIALDVARGMNYLHHRNPPIIHRDLKSSNLLVDKNWTVKVGDFGLSCIKQTNCLVTKTAKGTPQWMAPEVLRNEVPDEKSDVYSFGVILWELTTEQVPWQDLSSMQVVGLVGFMDARLEIPEFVDARLASIMKDCWESNPAVRPSFEEILVRLRQVVKQFHSMHK